MIIHDSFEDLILFLYVHLSHVDENYDPAELAIIKSKMPQLYPADVDFEKKLYATLKSYNAFDKNKLPTLFADSFRHFAHEQDAGRRKLLHDLMEIVEADGKVEAAESKALEALKQLMNH